MNGSAGGGGGTPERQGAYSPLAQTLTDSDDDSDAKAPEALVVGPSSAGAWSRMSTARRLWFVASVLFCIWTVAAFLWLLPCPTSSLTRSTKSSGWEKPYRDIELKGGIGAVEGARGKPDNLVLLYRGEAVHGKAASGGILCVVGDSGEVAWFIRQPRAPSELDCDLIDVDADGILDCIVVGEGGLLATFGSVTGTVHWYAHAHDNSQIYPSPEFPLILPDLDSDSIEDMLTIFTPNALLLISGRTGASIGVSLPVPECASISKLQIDKDHIVSFTCRNNTTQAESLRMIQFDDLYTKIANRPFAQRWDTMNVSKRHRIFGQRKETENQRNIYSVDGRKLIVENTGHCPKSCRVNVQLIDERSGRDNISWEYSAARVYGMVPATLSFALKTPISGFVLKFWQWNNANRFNRDVYDIFAGVDRRRSVDDGSPLNSDRVVKSNMTVNHLTERVVLVTFNSTDVHIVNASQSDVVQICTADDASCQPDMEFQENSLMIADLDGDGSQELVTYLSTFVCETASLDEYYGDAVKCDTEWTLRSTIRVVRLEAELPKLYEAVSHH